MVTLLEATENGRTPVVTLTPSLMRCMSDTAYKVERNGQTINAFPVVAIDGKWEFTGRPWFSVAPDRKVRILEG